MSELKAKRTEATENPDVVIVKTAAAPKLSPRGVGDIIYQVGRVGEAVHVRVAGNGGGGRHSREWIPVERIRAALAPVMKLGLPLKSDALAGAFVGRSRCNGGFLVAALRGGEGVFSPDAEHKGMSRLTGDLDAWEAAMRTAQPILVDGKPETAKLHSETKDTRFRPWRADGAETPGGEALQENANTSGKSGDRTGPILRRVRRVKKIVGDAASKPYDTTVGT